MLNKLAAFIYVFILILNINGCATVSAPARKEPKLICNASYVSSMMMAKAALKAEPLQLENGVVTKDSATLKGTYPGGQTVQIVITKINNSSSSLVVRGADTPEGKAQAQRLLEVIMQYSKLRK